jgi:hypothetical protein
MKSFVIMSKDSNKSISEEALLLEDRKMADDIASSLPDRIQISALSIKSKIPFKAIALRELLLQRISALATPAVELFEQKKFIPAVMLTRSIVETFALFYAMYDKIICFLDTNNIDELDDFLMPSLVGVKNCDKLPSPKSILKWIDRVDKKIIPNFRNNYDNLCEITHPNWAGTLGALGKIDRQAFELKLGLIKDSPTQMVGFNLLSSTLMAFYHYYNVSADLMLKLNAYFEQSDSEI